MFVKVRAHMHKCSLHRTRLHKVIIRFQFNDKALHPNPAFNYQFVMPDQTSNIRTQSTLDGDSLEWCLMARAGLAEEDLQVLGTELQTKHSYDHIRSLCITRSDYLLLWLSPPTPFSDHVPYVYSISPGKVRIECSARA